MGIFERMQKLTKPPVNTTESEPSKAEVNSIINGVITTLVNPTENKKGGYGFISSPELPFERIFFHWSGLRQDTLRFPDLRKRMQVEFKLIHDDLNGYKAIKIKVLNGE